MNTCSNVPASILDFFKTIWGENPEVQQVKKNVVYAIPGKELSVITDSYCGDVFRPEVVRTRTNGRVTIEKCPTYSKANMVLVRRIFKIKHVNLDDS